MKIDNINPNLIKYRMSFQQLHVPFLAITQLYVAFYRAYTAPTVNNRSGMPRSFVLMLQQFIVMSIFFTMAIISKKSFRVNIKSIPFILTTGFIHVAVAGQLFARSQIVNGPFITA